MQDTRKKKPARWSLCALGLVFAIVTTTPLPSEAHSPIVLSGYGTATVDGRVSPGEWTRATCVDFPVNVPEGGTTPGQVCAMNDTISLYLLVRFARTAAGPGNTASFEFDNDHDGIAPITGDDVLLINPDIGFFDEVRTTAPPCPPEALCGFLDSSVGGSNDGAGAFHNNGVRSVYEFAHPLNSDDNANDFSLNAGDTVGFILFIRLLAVGALADTRFPITCASCPSLFGDIVIAPPVPGPPSALTGSVTGNTVTLSWNAPSADSGLTSYRLEAGSVPGAANLAVLTLSASTRAVVFVSVANGTYFVRVRAVDAAGISAPSNELTVVVCGVGCTVPGAVTSLTFAISGNDVLLTWRAPADGAAPTGYVIEAGTASGLSNLGQFATGSTAPFVIVRGVPPGTYYVRVRAVSRGTVGPSSNEVVITP